jgi:hypothetical protein
VGAFWSSVRHVQPLAVGLNCALGAALMRPYIQELARLAGEDRIGHRSAPRGTEARMAPEEDGGKKGRAKAQPGEDSTLQAAADPRSGDMAGQDQGDRHGCGPAPGPSSGNARA